MIEAFQDSVDRYQPRYPILDRLRAATVHKITSYYYNKTPVCSINKVTATDNQPLSTPTIQETEV